MNFIAFGSGAGVVYINNYILTRLAPRYILQNRHEDEDYQKTTCSFENSSTENNFHSILHIMLNRNVEYD